MTEIIDKQIVQLNDDIESALRVIKDTLEAVLIMQVKWKLSQRWRIC